MQRLRCRIKLIRPEIFLYATESDLFIVSFVLFAVDIVVVAATAAAAVATVVLYCSHLDITRARLRS